VAAATISLAASLWINVAVPSQPAVMSLIAFSTFSAERFHTTSALM
jgi:hypothetical protein